MDYYSYLFFRRLPKGPRDHGPGGILRGWLVRKVRLFAEIKVKVEEMKSSIPTELMHGKNTVTFLQQTLCLQTSKVNDLPLYAIIYHCQ